MMDTAAIVSIVLALGGALITAARLIWIAHENRAAKREAAEHDRMAREREALQREREGILAFRAQQEQAPFDREEITERHRVALSEDQQAIIDQLRRQVEHLIDWTNKQTVIIGQLQAGHSDLRDRLAVAASDLLACRANEERWKAADERNRAVIAELRKELMATKRDKLALIAHLQRERDEHAKRTAQLEQHVEGMHRALREHGIDPIQGGSDER